MYKATINEKYINTIKKEETYLLNIDLVSFIIDECKNLLSGIVNLTGSQKFNNLYYKYLDYFELNKSIESFSLINYVAIIIPIIIYFIITILPIIFIYKGFYITHYLHLNKKNIKNIVKS